MSFMISMVWRLRRASWCQFRNHSTNARMPKSWQGGLVFVIERKLLIRTCRKLMKRLEELAHESSALKAYLVPQLDALCNIVSEMVNFGIQASIITICPFLFQLKSLF